MISVNLRLFGGRGGKSGVSDALANKRAKASKAKDMTDLRNVMRKYGINLSQDVEQVDYNLARDMVGAVERIMNEFPGLRGQMQSLEGGTLPPDVYASANLNGVIELNVSGMQDASVVEQNYMSDVASGYHPAGTTVESLVAHEMGHQIEAAIIKKRFPGGALTR